MEGYKEQTAVKFPTQSSQRHVENVGRRTMAFETGRLTVCRDWSDWQSRSTAAPPFLKSNNILATFQEVDIKAESTLKQPTYLWENGTATLVRIGLGDLSRRITALQLGLI